MRESSVSEAIVRTAGAIESASCVSRGGGTAGGLSARTPPSGKSYPTIEVGLISTK